MLQGMGWLRLLVACIAIAVGLAVPGSAMADTATSDLIAGPPPGSWQPYAQSSGPKTKEDIYGTGAGQIQQFVDSYQKVWTTQTPRQIMADRLERYSSAVWAAFRYGESHGAATKNKQHSSVNNVSGLGPNAYEVTDPADSNGFLRDGIVFQQGDYLAVISLYDTSQPDHATLMDQAKRQFDLIPLPVAEYNAIGHGVLVTIVVLVLVVLALAVIAGVIVLIVTQRRRRPQPQQPAMALRMSPDRTYWWDGQSWQDASRRMPTGAQLSPDGRQWWDGVSWRPRPPS